MNDKQVIDKLLQDRSFRQTVEKDIGFVRKVEVDWPKNEIRFYGSLSAKQIPIDATLATLKGRVQ